MRFNEFKSPRTDEVAPVVAGIGKAALGAAKLGAKAAVGTAKVAGRIAGNAAVGGAKLAGKGATKAGTAVAKKAAQVGAKAVSNVAQKVLKPGTTLPVGGVELKVDQIKGNDVTLSNPKAKPGEPKATVHDKKDPAIQQAVKQAAGI